MDCNLKQIPCECLNEEYSLLYKNKLDMNTSEHFNDFYKQIYKSMFPMEKMFTALYFLD